MAGRAVRVCRVIGALAVVAALATFPTERAGGDPGVGTSAAGGAEASSEGAAFGPLDPLEIALEVRELEVPEGALYQLFSVTMTSPTDTLCEEFDGLPYWGGANCWRPTGWAGNLTGLVNPANAAQRAVATVGVDCYKDFTNRIEDTTCTYRVSPPGSAGATYGSSLRAVGQAEHNGTGKPLLGRGGDDAVLPVNWNRLYPAPNLKPTADFTATPLVANPRAVAFANASVDPEGKPLKFEWNFGDGSAASSESDPVHVYGEPGTYTVTLTAMDPSFARDTISKSVVVGGVVPTVVNSTGDGAAQDVEGGSCDTGGTVGSSAECTLRAAIQITNEAGGGTISFDIAGGGIPAIATAELPAITGETTIDGTTQAAGGVAVTGSGADVFEIADGTATITGLRVRGADTSVRIRGGAGHQIVGNHLGTNADGTSSAGGQWGVTVNDAPDVEVRENVTGADGGVAVSKTADGIAIVDNTLGVAANGISPLGEPSVGIVSFGPDATLEGNVVRGEGTAIAVLGPEAAGTTVMGNRAGVDAGGAPFPDAGTAIRVDAAPDVTVSSNKVFGSGEGVIMVTGSAQYELGERVILDQPSADPRPGIATGGSVTISGNTVGFTDGDPTIGWGIVSWADASDVTLTGNSVYGATTRAVQLTGGSGHTVIDNLLGTEAAPSGTGIYAFEAEDTVIGTAPSGGNTIASTGSGVFLNQPIGSAQVDGNQISLVGDGPDAAIVVGPTAEAPSIASNVIDGAEVGIDTSADGATAIGNTIGAGRVGIDLSGTGVTATGNAVEDQSEVGIESTGDDGTISSNSVTGSAIGLRVRGDGSQIDENRVGLAFGSDAVVGNTGLGIAISGDDVSATRNLVAGSGGDGIVVGTDATAELRSNQIWGSSTGIGIAAPGGPDAPEIVGVVRSGSGDTLRRTIVIKGLPAADAGRIEVFANESCDDPEARYLMEILRTKGVDETARIIQVKGAATRDHFTLTYTSADGSTSELSDCRSGATFSDGDGDGVVDPIDRVADAQDDPAVAVVATDEEQLLLMGVAPFDPETNVGGGQLESVTAMDDPDPAGHPSGWDLPYGALSFRIVGLQPGGRTSVVLATIGGAPPIVGTSYWKYGPPVAGAPPSWYAFDYDAASDTGGAKVVGNFPGLPIQQGFLLRFVDGGRGDSDGGANGSITDPGGPVILDQTVPTTTSTTSTPTTTSSTSLPNGVTSTAVASAPTNPTGSDAITDGTLPRTGSDVVALTWMAAGLIGTGMVVLVARRRNVDAGSP